jgi:hypothetical protein
LQAQDILNVAFEDIKKSLQENFGSELLVCLSLADVSDMRKECSIMEPLAG